MKRDVLRVYGIIDPAVAGDRSLPDLAREAVAGGITILQFRDKTGSTQDMIAAAKAIRAALAGSGVPFLINDRVDVALVSGADGVHVGQDDMAPEDARRLLGPDAIIGQSVKTHAEAEAAPLDLLDYVCMGGVFATSSKNNPNPPVGVEGFATLVNAIRARVPGYPVGAIAGITAETAGSLIAVGADGVAVISEIFGKDDVRAAAETLRRAVDGALAERG
ncbi:MAG: thiamine phosphate synthase [Hyphomicrobiales bacterium]|nr:MAG: thiamine phosphate synthase [Hyphomicrobiales bacterium]